MLRATKRQHSNFPINLKEKTMNLIHFTNFHSPFHQFLPNSSPKKQSLSVSFNPEIQVISIPCRQDYIDCNLHQDLWWNSQDLLSFRQESRMEVFVVRTTRNLDLKSALKFLHQPDNLQDQDLCSNGRIKRSPTYYLTCCISRHPFSTRRR
jgi:hypothetical protein